MNHKPSILAVGVPAPRGSALPRAALWVALLLGLTGALLVFRGRAASEPTSLLLGDSVEVVLRFRGEGLERLLDAMVEIHGEDRIPEFVRRADGGVTALLFDVPVASAAKLLLNAEILAEEIQRDERFVDVTGSTNPTPGQAATDLRHSQSHSSGRS
jgi:hypothetical protein